VRYADANGTITLGEGTQMRSLSQKMAMEKQTIHLFVFNTLAD
jgi:hypothetical protein